MANKETEKQEKAESVKKYARAQILASERYANRKDVLAVLLEDKEYTSDEITALLDKFMKGKVN